MIPKWARTVVKGDTVKVHDDVFGRGGQHGTIIEEPTEEGVVLDFFYDVGGDLQLVMKDSFLETEYSITPQTMRF